MSTTGDNNDRQCWNGGEMVSSKKEYTSCEQNNNNVDNITEGIDSAGVSDVTSTCACCGKQGNSNNMNTCNKCKSVKYCNAACKKKHRTKHKKACERRVAELYEEQLFKEPPPNEECPICMLLLLRDNNTETFMSCCGKTICSGCIYAMQMSEGKDLCPFCRTPPPSSDEDIKRIKKQMDKGNAEAFHLLAGMYDQGIRGLSRDRQKAHELLLKAGDLGCARGYYNLGLAYNHGEGVEVDKKKAMYYFELAAIGGDIHSRHNLGADDWNKANKHRAMKHFIIAARAGEKRSLDAVKGGFMKGIVTKDDYANTLRAHHEIQKEMKSDERDKAVLYFASRSYPFIHE